MRPSVPADPETVDGRVLRVPREVLVEVLKEHSLEKVNAMPYERRLELADEAARRIAERTRAALCVGAANDETAAAQLRADRARRKAEAWAKRQPKGGATP